MSNVKDLSRILADKRKLSVTDAEKFMSLMIDVINDGLNDNKLLKIKGLGTFKVTSVSPRESVDVNTGERILIDGREKISFLPDNAMRELVNRPFSQFETVVINDGVDFGQAEQESEDTLEDSSDETPESDLEETVEPVENSEVAEAVEDVVANVDPIVEHDVKDDAKPTLDDVIDDTAEEKEESHVVEETAKTVEHEADTHVDSEKTVGTVESEIKNAVSVPTQTSVCADEKVIETNNQPQIKNADEIKSDDEKKQNSESDPEPQPVKHNTLINKLLVISIFALFALSAGAFFYMFNELAERNCRIDSLVSRLEERKVKPIVKPIKHIAAKPQQIVKAPIQKSDDSVVKKKESEVAIVDKYAAMNNSDARVRTGAYKIVGVQKTIKVKAGQTLNSISRLYFGPGMECYIEVMNGKTELKEGDMIKIPELKNKHSR